MKIIFAITVIALLSGCASGTKINYSEGIVKFNKFTLNAERGCSVEVIDQRPYVLSGKKTPKFVGIRRGGYGNPFDVLTESGFPLAFDLNLLFKRSYAQVLGTHCNKDPERVEKRITYVLNEFKTDVFHRGWFIYDIKTIVAKGENEISAESTKGRIVLDKNFQLHMALIQAMNEIHSNPNTSVALAE